MRRWNLSHYAISSCVTAALLAGCSGSQTPIAAPGALPQTSALAARINRTHYRVVYSFVNGLWPIAPLTDVGGKLYGTTEYGGGGNCFHQFPGCGIVYRLSLNGHEKLLHSFAVPPDGIYPLASLIDAGGTLYGTTQQGGSNKACGYYSYYFSCGTVFSVTPSGTEKVLHSFGNSPDGNFPVAGLIDVNGTLYGTTQFGGGDKNKCGVGVGCGTVFSITPSGTEKVLHSFSGGSDGAVSAASLIEVKGKLYGTTESGGTYGYGTVFRITLSGREKVLYSFGPSGSDGAFPEAGLIDLGGTLYGTTYNGGTHGDGTVFSVTLSGTEKVLHSFGGYFYGRDGALPTASLTKVKGTLYGTTVSGGANSANEGGTVFSVTTTGVEKVLHSFRNGDGSGPYASLINVNGTLYGTTQTGGTYGDGAVFALKL